MTQEKRSDMKHHQGSHKSSLKKNTIFKYIHNQENSFLYIQLHDHSESMGADADDDDNHFNSLGQH